MKHQVVLPKGSYRGSGLTPQPLPGHTKASRRRLVCRAEAPSNTSMSTLSTIDSLAVEALGPHSPIDRASLSLALAAKANAARELARRLEQERMAGEAGGPQDAEAMKNAEDASVAAATQAARADALARALRKAESTRDQLQRLKAENEALKELLIEVAGDKDNIKHKIDSIMGGSAMGTMLKKLFPSIGLPVPSKDAGGGAPAPPQAAPAAAAPAPAPPAPPAPAPPPTPAPAPVAPPAPAPAAAAPAAAVQPPAAAPAPPEAAPAAASAAAEAAPAAAAPEAQPPAVPVPSAAIVAALEAAVALEAASLAAAPPAPTTPKPLPGVTAAELLAAAAAAKVSGAAFFTFPPSPVPVFSEMRLFYDRARGPLPAGCTPHLKLGLNAWESIENLPMQRAQDLAAAAGQEWWEVKVALPSELFKADFVVVDPQRNITDNNGMKDFHLSLANAPTEEEVIEGRLAAFEAMERVRRERLEAENKALWRQVEQRALEAATEARINFRKRRDEAHRAAAEKVVADRRPAALTNLPTAPAVKGVYAWLEGPPKAGTKAKFVYNLGQGPINQKGGGSARMHLGYDGWANKVTQTVDLNAMAGGEPEKLGLTAGWWWTAEVEIPRSAAVLDFVMSDKEQKNWDNNGGKDFHTQVADAHSEAELVEAMYKTIVAEKVQEDREMEDRMARAAAKKIKARATSLQKRREVLNEFLYTVPLKPKAGQKCEVYYNPDLTALRGRPSVYMRNCFNRWSKSLNKAPSNVIRMEPTLPGGLGFYKAVVDVPEDAWGMDMVFADNEKGDSGFVDNNGGLDYHLPVEGTAGTAKAPLLKVVHIAVEMAPIAKVGGMGDVVTALGRAVRDEGHQVEVIVPKYDIINYKLVEGLKQDGEFPHDNATVKVWKGVVEELPTIFLEPSNGHFWAGCIYGKNNDAQRFGYFCGAALEYLRRYNVKPDIVHCHDWQSAPVAWGNRAGARTVFTIHNLSYGADLVGRAMQACEVATTVSPTYAREISGAPAIAPQLSKLYGIRNGIDAEVWDPENDAFLPQPYNADTVVEGKAAARKELRKRLNLAQVDVPIVSCVTRLVAQKGIHLIKHAAWRTLERGGQFVLLGSAPDPRVQGEFNALRDQLMRQYHDRAALVFTYDEPLSHLIYAGSDMFLVPSMFEPCGLTQMIAMNYGAIPVVRKTGGLADTVFDVDTDEERAKAAGMEVNGYSFDATDTNGLDWALNRALASWYNDKDGFRALQGRVMRMDWSWGSPAMDYVELYHKALRT